MDLVLVTHFHLDHCGGLPWFLEHTTFKDGRPGRPKGRVFMTHATKSIYRLILKDYVRVRALSVVVRFLFCLLL